MKNKHVKTYGRFLVFLIFGGILFFNLLTPYIADDWSYASASDFLDIFRQEYSHYFTTNGRSFAHIIARTFLLLGKNNMIWVFDVANSIVYMIFSFLIYIHATYGLKLNSKDKLLCGLLIHLLLIIYVVNYGQVFLWLDGSCNYLWTTTVILIFLLPYRIYFTKDNFSEKAAMPLYMFFLGAIAGWCNENTSGGAILLAMLFCVIFSFRKSKLKIWMFTGILSSCITFVIMILSPGNARRRTYFVDNRKWYIKYPLRFQSIANNIYNDYKYLLFAMIIFLCLLISICIAKAQLELIFIYMLTALAIFFSLILSPASNGRPFFGGSIFMIVVCTSMAAYLLYRKEQFEIIIPAYIGLLSLVFVVNLVNATVDVAHLKVHSDQRDAYVIQKRDAGYSNIVVGELSPKPQTKYSANYGLSDLLNNPHEWPSTAYANYYNLNTVTAVSDDMFQKVFENGDYELIDCRDIYEYMKKINHPQYTVCMAVNDDSSGAVTEELVSLMSELGLKTDLRDGFRYSYIAVIDSGKVLFEEHDNKVLNYYDQVNGNSIEITSSGKIYNKGNMASIKINGYEYARNSCGLNMVVIDNTSGKVVDRVTFNTWNGLEASR